MIAASFRVSGLDAVVKSLEKTHKQIVFATAKSLTQTAKRAQAGIGKEMRAKFDRPTPYTLNSSFIKPATRDNLVAVVGIKDVLPSKAALSPVQVLGHQFQGGGRERKKLERYLTSAGLLGPGEFIAPGAGARLDAYGNLSRGQGQQIISQLRIGLDPHVWKSNSKRSKRNVRQAGRIFWSRGGLRDAHLQRGAWVDLGGSVGLRPLLVVIKRPMYRARIDFERTVEGAVAKNWDRIFEGNLANALATAR